MSITSVHFDLYKFLARRVHTIGDLQKIDESISDWEIQGLQSKCKCPVDKELVSDTARAILSGEGISKSLFWAARRNLLITEGLDSEFQLSKESPLEIDLLNSLGLHYCGSRNNVLYVSRNPNDLLKSTDDLDGPIPVKGFKLHPEQEVEIENLVYSGLDNGSKLKVITNNPVVNNDREIHLHFTGPQHTNTFYTPPPLAFRLKIA